jgi:hypothetical protein
MFLYKFILNVECLIFNVECFIIELALKIQHSTLKIKTKVPEANFEFSIGIKKFCVTSDNK